MDGKNTQLAMTAREYLVYFLIPFLVGVGIAVAAYFLGNYVLEIATR